MNFVLFIPVFTEIGILDNSGTKNIKNNKTK